MTREEYDLSIIGDAAYFTVVRGANPKTRTRLEAVSIEAARSIADEFGDGRSMIYAVGKSGRDCHVENR